MTTARSRKTLLLLLLVLVDQPASQLPQQAMMRMMQRMLRYCAALADADLDSTDPDFVVFWHCHVLLIGYSDNCKCWHASGQANVMAAGDTKLIMRELV